MGESFITSLIFIVIILSALFLDLGLLSGESATKPTFKQSALRSAGWFGLGLLSVLGVYYFSPQLHAIHDFSGLQKYASVHGNSFTITNELKQSMHNFQTASALAYLSGFLLEYALSIDNLFVMLLILKSFKIEEKHERKILVWGVLGAMILRFIFVYLGSAAIQQFHWVLYVFGAFLMFSGVKMLMHQEDEELDTENHFVMRWVKKIMPVTNVSTDRGNFFIKENGKWHATILFVVLIIIELTDVVFAVDSVPAVFGVTTDPYLVFFSNIFALLGLRSLYFLIGYGIDKFYALKYGLSIILVYIGLKMLLEDYFHKLGFSHFHNLIIIVGILAASIFFSIIRPKEH
ncbi:MAG: TerC/Alx family metal homeostasis membrane protein [Bacteroidia bacterium]|nr:TerC/Alx family metal homeostasis membrane protein [Bacteroidia bacterium]